MDNAQLVNVDRHLALLGIAAHAKNKEAFIREFRLIADKETYNAVIEELLYKLLSERNNGRKNDTTT